MNGSGYSAAWFSAFDWGSKGREFESLYPDHFFCFFYPYCLKISLSQKRRSGVANFVCRRLAFLLFRAFQALTPGRAERFFRQLPRSTSPSACSARLFVAPRRIPLRSSSNLSIPTKLLRKKVYVVTIRAFIRGNRNNRRHPPPAHGRCERVARERAGGERGFPRAGVAARG